MNPTYSQIIAASDAGRAGLFAAAAARLGTAIQNVEKTSAYAGRSTRFSMGSSPIARAFSSSAELRCPRPSV